MSLIAGLIGTVVAVLIMWGQRAKSGERDYALLNTDETEFYPLEQVVALCSLQSPGPFVLKTFRQSGNAYKDDLMFDTASAAVKSAVSTFRRAQIEIVVVMFNTESEFSLRRGWKCHRGHHEGKKLGWIEIHRA